MEALKTARSYLFVPANRPDFIAKASEKGADIIVLDLEDSVPSPSKPRARQQLLASVAQLEARGQWVAVRINAELEHLRDDLDALDLKKVAAVLLPKVEDAGFIRLVDSYLEHLECQQEVPSRGLPLIAMIETCRGALNAREIATSSPRICALALGSEDLSAQLGVPPTAQSLTGICQQLVLDKCRRPPSSAGEAFKV